MDLIKSQMMAMYSGFTCTNMFMVSKYYSKSRANVAIFLQYQDSHSLGTVQMLQEVCSESQLRIEEQLLWTVEARLRQRKLCVCGLTPVSQSSCRLESCSTKQSAGSTIYDKREL